MEANKFETAAKQELHKFFSLIPDVTDLGSMKMPSCVVDDEWHELMRNEQDYILFCSESAGSYIGHAPGNGQSEIEWVGAYEKRYGKLPHIWFTQKNGFFDENGYQKYQDTGVMIASWDCGPVMPDKGKAIQSDIDNLKKIVEINKKISQLNEIPIPELEKMEKIDESTILNSIKEKIDRFNIEKIKEKYPKK
ncbi:MAG: hypothetical protein V5B34_04845 [Accumulibacter sp.]